MEDALEQIMHHTCSQSLHGTVFKPTSPVKQTCTDRHAHRHRSLALAGPDHTNTLVNGNAQTMQQIAWHLSSVMRKPTIWFPNRSNTNQAVQAQQMARCWKFLIQNVQELYNPCSENKGTDQLRSYCEADLRLCFRMTWLIFL